MEQMTMFGATPYKIKTPIRLIELFAGVGSQAMALRDIGAEFEHYRVVEFDKYAIKSYNAIHGTNFEPMDICNVHGSDLGIVDKDRFTYLLTYSFPCTDLSVAGKMQGMKEGTGTKSSLLWEVKRLLTECDELPQILLMENVTQVHGKKNLDEFNRWLDFLKGLGYTTVWQDMNAKDYGVAQSRNRCFALSMLGNYSYEFPKPYKLDKTVRDYLEEHVDEKYYLNSERARKLIDKLIVDGNLPLRNTPPTHSCQLDKMRSGHLDSIEDAGIKNIDLECASTLTARYYKGIGANGDNMVMQTRKMGGVHQSTSQFATQQKSMSQTAYPLEQTEECQSNQVREPEFCMYPGYLNLMKCDAVDVDVARTIMARDYKGFGSSTETQNGVIEIEKR